MSTTPPHSPPPDHPVRPHRLAAGTVLCDFAIEYGVSLDWLIAGDIAALLKYAAIGYKITTPKGTEKLAGAQS